MNYFEKLIYFLQGEMNSPTAYSCFHLLWILFIILSIIILYKKREKYNEKQLKIVLSIYGITALTLEILKQIIWSFNYDPLTNIITWNYEWYSFPFQLCTTPIYVSIICLFLKKNKVRNYLLSYMAYVTILGSIMTMIIPDSCFTSDILVNIHTMWLHAGSLVVSIYLLLIKEVQINTKSIKKALITFIIFVIIALTMNLVIYNSGILNGETFNMFFISPYFISTLPVFNIIQENVPYLVFLIIYIWAVIIGSLIIYCISLLIDRIHKNIIKHKFAKIN